MGFYGTLVLINIMLGWPLAVIPMQNYNKFTERQTNPSKYRISPFKRGHKKAEA
jgi:hypothetical protein